MSAINYDVLLAVSLRKHGAWGDHQFKARVVSSAKRARPGEVVLKLKLEIPRGLFSPCAWVVNVAPVQVPHPIASAEAVTP